MNLLKYKHKKRDWNENFRNIPVTLFELNKEGAHEFNQVLKYVYSLNLPTIIRTESGGICNGRLFNKYNCFDFRFTKICAEITLLTLEGCWRFQCRTKLKTTNPNGNALYGTVALSEFKKICLSVSGIDLDDYATTDGMEIKAKWKEEEKPIYKKYIHPMSSNLKDVTIESGDVHHIDLCSGFQSGLARAFPEFKDACQHLYNLRKNEDGTSNDYIKAIQVESIGAMWSDQSKAKYIKLAKGAIEENNRLLKLLIGKLISTGRQILMLNTDGIWYKGEIYHDETEKHDLGGWKNDHKNCTKFRMKNNVTYEFVEDGKYTAVMSGTTTLDQVKTRSEWEWGDIYKAAVIEYLIDKDGIKSVEGDLL